MSSVKLGSLSSTGPLQLTASLKRLLDTFHSFIVDNQVWKAKCFS